MSKLSTELKKVFWKLPIPGTVKEKMRMKYAERKFVSENNSKGYNVSDENNEYARYVLEIPKRTYEGKCKYIEHESVKDNAIMIAYYLTQYSPDDHNDMWWGKGVTEWNNVSRAVPQFVGHRQPILPGELGFYDLRIKDNMREQIKYAKNYGIDVFSFYYYWFDGERILERPLNMFLNDPELDMPFMFCWANENWTRNFSGTDQSVLIGMDNTEENYKKFIHEIMPYFSDNRYFKLNDKYVLQIYRPALIPEVENVVKYWRDAVKAETGKELYLIACQGRNVHINWCDFGFDAENEWMMDSIKNELSDVTDKVHPVRSDFSGLVYDYSEIVNKKKYYIKNNRLKKVYPAIMPSWDNTARRDNKGTIFVNSTPELYKTWLKDIITEVNNRDELDAPIIFVNAWNEWGEGAYMEPDKDYGFAYLEANWQAREETGV